MYGVLGPAALLDVAALEGVETLEPGRVVTEEDLRAYCERQGVSVEPGSVALVHTGNARHCTVRSTTSPGRGYQRGLPAGAHCITFVCASLKLVWATGSTVRPLAVLPG